MQYRMKLAAAGVLAVLAGPTWAGPVSLPGGDLHWECPSGGCSADTLVQFEAAQEVEGGTIPSQLLVIGEGLILGKTEEGWQSIKIRVKQRFNNHVVYENARQPSCGPGHLRL